MWKDVNGKEYPPIDIENVIVKLEPTIDYCDIVFPLTPKKEQPKLI